MIDKIERLIESLIFKLNRYDTEEQDDLIIELMLRNYFLDVQIPQPIVKNDDELFYKIDYNSDYEISEIIDDLIGGDTVIIKTEYFNFINGEYKHFYYGELKFYKKY